MARNISEIHSLVDYIVRKQRGGFVTDTEIDQHLHSGQMDLFNMYYEQYGKSQKLHDALSNFKEQLQFTNATSVLGRVTVPSDYEHFLYGFTSVYNNTTRKSKRYKIISVEEDELIDALSSQLRPVSETRVLLIQEGTVFQLYPQQAMVGELWYLKTPQTPVYSYTTVGRTQTYVPSTSVQLDWNDSYINAIILNALSYISVNLNEQELTQYAEAKSKEVS